MEREKLEAIYWSDDSLKILNQTLLPIKVEYKICTKWQDVEIAIKRLEVRGAPLIGVVAAYGVVLGAIQYKNDFNNSNDFKEKIREVSYRLSQTRPTAVNLFWAIEKMIAVLNNISETTDAEIILKLKQEADKIFSDNKESNEKLALYGAELFTKPVNVLTYCNTGTLATAACGTALGVIRAAYDQKKIVKVYAAETRPLLQGARLTAFELMQDKIDVTLITDNMVGWLMKNKMVEACIVGADRIAANGDTANKIGTYTIAVLAKEHNIPFYVAAPLSTFDFTISSGKDIVIEEREKEEIISFGSSITAPLDVKVFNPAFDVTNSELISAIITEKGILKYPYSESISKICREEA
ncbi:S-methyl-5-thioribose-1-phosphate isomerase [Selenomonadales bacterium OttesenSCG-928-I06]|nr:S-methyl-5-thioribose-1-phosphate isomerase [Selenomonadales bacterium OttesenSCG-928-I06]